MKYLFIDTSNSFINIYIINDNNVLVYKKVETLKDMANTIMPLIREAFNEVKFDIKDIDKIFVTIGPGSFTGIRIGITIAKVYAWSLNIPITTITSLEAMAVSSDNSKIHVPIINARRGYVYAAIFDDEQISLPPQHIKYSELIHQLERLDNYEFISNDEFDFDIITCPYIPNYLKIVNKYKDKNNFNPHSVNPEYLKLTEAEESRL